MILIADSGSTKTDWAVVPNSQFSTLNSQLSTLKSQGLNPYHQSPEAISRILHEELLPQMDSTEVDCIYFYGSGVSADKEPLMQELLRQAFPQATVVEAHSDMLGAAHALCGGSEGIACILGTGANSCLFDGSVLTMAEKITNSFNLRSLIDSNLASHMQSVSDCLFIHFI